MRASRWDLKPAGKVKASHSVTLCIGEIPSLVVLRPRAGRIAGPSYAHVAVVELERAR
jgi:hypothetical protein